MKHSTSYVPARLQILQRPKTGEKPDPTPIEIPSGCTQKSETLEEMMSRMLRNRLAEYNSASEPDEPVSELDLEDDEDPELTDYTLMETEQGLVTAEDLANHMMDMIENPPVDVTSPEDKTPLVQSPEGEATAQPESVPAAAENSTPIS